MEDFMANFIKMKTFVSNNCIDILIDWSFSNDFDLYLYLTTLGARGVIEFDDIVPHRLAARCVLEEDIVPLWRKYINDTQC
jgi:hypothetical protein